MKSLKRCPHCGGNAKEEQTKGSFGGYHLTTIYCQNCSASASNAKDWNKVYNKYDDISTKDDYLMYAIECIEEAYHAFNKAITKPSYRKGEILKMFNNLLGCDPKIYGLRDAFDIVFEEEQSDDKTA